MFDVLYDVRDKIDRVKALEADKARTASQYDEAQKVLRDKKTAGVPPSDEDMERVHDAMATRVSLCAPSLPKTRRRKKHVTDCGATLRKCDRPPRASRS